MWKGQSFQQVVLGKWDPYSKRMKQDYCLMPYTKINSNSIKDMNVRDSENTNTNLLEENIGGKLLDISLGDDFFNLTPKQKKKKSTAKEKGNILNGRKYLKVI